MNKNVFIKQSGNVSIPSNPSSTGKDSPLKLFAASHYYVDYETTTIIAAHDKKEAETLAREDGSGCCPVDVEELQGCTCDRDNPGVIFNSGL